MAIQTVESRIHGVHRDFTDVVVTLVIGIVLLALLPAKREAVGRRALPERSSARAPRLGDSKAIYSLEIHRAQEILQNDNGQEGRKT